MEERFKSVTTVVDSTSNSVAVSSSEPTIKQSENVISTDLDILKSELNPLIDDEQNDKIEPAIIKNVITELPKSTAITGSYQVGQPQFSNAQLTQGLEGLESQILTSPTPVPLATSFKANTAEDVEKLLIDESGDDKNRQFNVQNLPKINEPMSSLNRLNHLMDTVANIPDQTFSRKPYRFPLTLSETSLDKGNNKKSEKLLDSADIGKHMDRGSDNKVFQQISSTFSYQCDNEPSQVDGVISSKINQNKSQRNRIEERYNGDLLSAVFDSKPVEEIQKLLDKGANIATMCRDSGASVLHVAALNGDTNAVELLISKGADVKARDRAGKQPIHIAAWEGALPVIKVLCQHDQEIISSKIKREDPFVVKNPDSWNHKHDQINKYWQPMESISEGSTPLHVACRRTKESCVKFLIEAGADTLEEDFKGLFPVDVVGLDAVNREASDSLEGSVVGIAKLLIGFQKVDTSGFARMDDSVKSRFRIKRLFSSEEHHVRPITALHTAVNDNNLNLITILMDEGADVLVWNESGFTPLHLAVKKKFLDALCLMLRHGDNRERRVVDAIDRTQNRSLLYYAVAEEWTDGISILLEENADITKKNIRSETVLHLAASSGNLKILNELLTVPNVNLIINAVDADCYAPIHKTVENKNLSCLEALIKNNAKAEILLPDGRTLLHILAKNDSVDLLEYLMDSTQLNRLMENKTSVKDGAMTALHVAASLGHCGFAKTLLKFGSDIMAKTDNSSGSTPIHLAAEYDKTNVISILLMYDKGDILQLKDGHGWYPLHVGASHGHEECVDMLLRAGADIGLTVQDEQGTQFTALDIIMTCVHRPVDFLVKILDSYIIVDTTVPVTNPQCKIEVDFDLLLPNPPEEKQLGVLEAVLNNGSEILEEAFFLHPIVQTFIHLKSKNMFFFFALFFDLFFFLAFYLSVIAYHGPFTLQQPLYRYILIGLLSINILFEIMNVARLQRYYLKDAETWIKWCVYLNILVIVIHPTDLVLRYNMAVSILLSWTELLLIIAKYPAWGIYVLMFATVAGTILKVLAVFSLLLVGFAFTFRALFQEKGPFNSVWSSLVKVIIMVYELDYRGTMEETIEEGPFFADVARLFYLMFVLMVSVSLVNLMLGLAVSDIADLKRKGGAKRLAKQVAFLGGLENLLYCWPLGYVNLFRRNRKVPRCLVVKAGSRLGKTTDSPVPPYLKEAIVEKARSVQRTLKSETCSPYRDDVTQMIKQETSSIASKKSFSTSRNKINLLV